MATEPIYKMVNGEKVEMSPEETAEYLAHCDNRKKQQQDNLWLNNRIAAYPPIKSQLDMMYWDKVNNTTVWLNTIASIKKTYPKPQE